MTADLAVAALQTAIAGCEPDGVVIVHADPRSQLRARSFQAVLKKAGHHGAMGRLVSAGDNAAMESVRALLQHNFLNTGPYRTRAELPYEITYWIGHTCNRRRGQRSLKRHTPIEFELAITTSPHIAAWVTQRE